MLIEHKNVIIEICLILLFTFFIYRQLKKQTMMIQRLESKVKQLESKPMQIMPNSIPNSMPNSIPNSMPDSMMRSSPFGGEESRIENVFPESIDDQISKELNELTQEEENPSDSDISDGETSDEEDTVVADTIKNKTIHAEEEEVDVKEEEEEDEDEEEDEEEEKEKEKEREKIRTNARK